MILSVPHGGKLRPACIPQRDAGYIDPTTGEERYNHNGEKKDPVNCAVHFKKDTNTIELAENIADEIKELTGKRPHVIICHIHRSKLDMNCDKEKATFCVKTAVEAWTAYHKFIADAKQSFNGSTGLFLDIHGQAHIENWVELGYTLSKEHLNQGDYAAGDTSIRYLANRLRNKVQVRDLICGLDSFGGILLDEGYKAVPSPTYPGPGTGEFYTGGYNTQTHGSKHGGIVDGIQIESPRFLREKTMIPEYAKALARTIIKFLDLYYKKVLRESPKSPKKSLKKKEENLESEKEEMLKSKEKDEKEENSDETKCQ